MRKFNSVKLTAILYPFLSLFVFYLIPNSVTANFNLRVQTDLGSLDIELFDTTAPLTVANFMNYVNAGQYDGTFFHLSIPNSIVQGGGFVFDPSRGEFDSGGVGQVLPNPPVVNEFNLSNVRGTIAMSKDDNADPDSATSQWFFNVGDNSAEQDNLNGGSTVFAQVLGNGMDVVDDINSLLRCNLVLPIFLCQFPDLPFAGFDPVFNTATLANISHIGFDNEGDGAIDDLEDAGPNNGDGNNDTILDSTQQHIAYFPSESGEYVVIEVQPTSPLSSLHILGTTFGVNNPDPEGVLIDRNFASGLYGYDITNAVFGDNMVTVTLPVDASPELFINFGPTPDDANPHWYDFTFDGNTGAEFNGNVVTLHYMDGLRGDDDLLANGAITAARGGAADITGDGDGIADLIEDGAPNNGDGNNDGIPDKQQPNVASLVAGVNGGYVTVEVDANFLLQNPNATDAASILAAASLEMDLSGLNFAHDLLGFSIKNVDAGDSLQVKIYLPEGVNADKYFKFGPTPDNPDDHLYEFDFDGATGAEINGNVITLHFVDGERGDADLTANGEIADPGTPALRASNSGSGGGGGGGCSLNKRESRAGQAGAWLFMLGMLCLYGGWRRYRKCS